MFLSRRILCSAFLIAAVLLQTIGCAPKDNPDVQILSAESLYGGIIFHYSVALSPKATKLLQDSLDGAVTVDSLAAVFKKLWKGNKLPPQAILLIVIIAADTVLFKKSLSENTGSNGVIIDVWGPNLKQKDSTDLCFRPPSDMVRLPSICIAISAPDSKSKDKDVFAFTVPDKYKETVTKIVFNAGVVSTLVSTIPAYWEITPRN